MKNKRRLTAIAAEISFKRMADIGSDHAYVPILAARRGRITRAAACDINAAPLERAAENIGACGLSEIIETRSGFGLTPLFDFLPETIVIAGMGGRLIISILSGEPEITGGALQLVLQPQRHVPEVRKYVRSIGFEIANEVMVCEHGQYYFILNCIRADRLEEYSETDYLYGKVLINRRDPILKQYLKERAEKFLKILPNIANDTEYLRVSAMINTMEDIIKCL
ncbi:MAG: class I SAM-dependent methyltransferase [Clostridiales bacterium]|jgi:tRNA (adenine22-N1)-methyltransferase|nr:class I SAM-dependent methyltransferase [Clostridiales bacterium]